MQPTTTVKTAQDDDDENQKYQMSALNDTHIYSHLANPVLDVWFEDNKVAGEIHV